MKPHYRAGPIQVGFALKVFYKDFFCRVSSLLEELIFRSPRVCRQCWVLPPDHPLRSLWFPSSQWPELLRGVNPFTTLQINVHSRKNIALIPGSCHHELHIVAGDKLLLHLPRFVFFRALRLTLFEEDNFFLMLNVFSPPRQFRAIFQVINSFRRISFVRTSYIEILLYCEFLCSSVNMK